MWTLWESFIATSPPSLYPPVVLQDTLINSRGHWTHHLITSLQNRGPPPDLGKCPSQQHVRPQEGREVRVTRWRSACCSIGACWRALLLQTQVEFSRFLCFNYLWKSQRIYNILTLCSNISFFSLKCSEHGSGAASVTAHIHNLWPVNEIPSEMWCDMESLCGFTFKTPSGS